MPDIECIGADAVTRISAPMVLPFGRLIETFMPGTAPTRWHAARTIAFAWLETLVVGGLPVELTAANREASRATWFICNRCP